MANVQVTKVNLQTRPSRSWAWLLKPPPLSNASKCLDNTARLRRTRRCSHLVWPDSQSLGCKRMFCPSETRAMTYFASHKYKVNRTPKAVKWRFWRRKLIKTPLLCVSGSFISRSQISRPQIKANKARNKFAWNVSSCLLCKRVLCHARLALLFAERNVLLNVLWEVLVVNPRLGLEKPLQPRQERFLNCYSKIDPSTATMGDLTRRSRGRGGGKACTDCLCKGSYLGVAIFWRLTFKRKLFVGYCFKMFM